VKCDKKGKKVRKEIKKDLTEPALLEMDGFALPDLALKSRGGCRWRRRNSSISAHLTFATLPVH